MIFKQGRKANFLRLGCAVNVNITGPFVIANLYIALNYIIMTHLKMAGLLGQPQSAETGKYVSKLYAMMNPATTFTERIVKKEEPKKKIRLRIKHPAK